MEYRLSHLPPQKLIATVPNIKCFELVQDVIHQGALDKEAIAETLEAAQKIDQDGVCAIQADAERIFQEDALLALMLPDEEVDKAIMIEKKRRVDEDIAKILEGDLIKRLDTFRESKVEDDVGRCEALAGLGIQLKRVMVRMDAMKGPAKPPLLLARRAFVSSLCLDHVSARSEDRYDCYGVMNCTCQNLLEVACAMGGCLDGKEEVVLCVAFYLLSAFQVECYEMMQRELDIVQQQVSNRYSLAHTREAIGMLLCYIESMLASNHIEHGTPIYAAATIISMANLGRVRTHFEYEKVARQQREVDLVRNEAEAARQKAETELFAMYEADTTTKSGGKPRKKKQANRKPHSSSLSAKLAVSNTTAVPVSSLSAKLAVSNTTAVPVSSSNPTDWECVVCLDQAKTILLLPCRHMCVCRDCCTSILNVESSVCPLCRNPIDSHIEVFV